MEIYTHIGKESDITIYNENADKFEPKNNVQISWPSFGDRDIEFAENFLNDLAYAIKVAKGFKR